MSLSIQNLRTPARAVLQCASAAVLGLAARRVFADYALNDIEQNREKYSGSVFHFDKNINKDYQEYFSAINLLVLYSLFVPYGSKLTRVAYLSFLFTARKAVFKTTAYKREGKGSAVRLEVNTPINELKQEHGDNVTFTTTVGPKFGKYLDGDTSMKRFAMLTAGLAGIYFSTKI